MRDYGTFEVQFDNKTIYDGLSRFERKKEERRKKEKFLNCGGYIRFSTAAELVKPIGVQASIKIFDLFFCPV